MQHAALQAKLEATMSAHKKALMEAESANRDLQSRVVLLKRDYSETVWEDALKKDGKLQRESKDDEEFVKVNSKVTMNQIFCLFF